MHPMSTSGYYILVTHYDIVSPVPRLGDPHGAGALHHDFRMRHFQRQLSSDVLRRIESQLFVKDRDLIVPKEREPSHVTRGHPSDP